ncbi:glycoside hydrolase family 19 protein [Pseudomonas pseudonitroreducens]|uniref:glycoside hydrolase family 19 protein n=1 Tax=Pseudomonas pseudonitroreducens TaxID=2892326 RepID=UPI001F3FB895|nr:hypothetical protein [Pseudomonas pseudonitroreducens]
MLNYLRDLYEGLMDVYRNQRDGPPQPRPVPVLTPTPSPLAPAPLEKTPVPATALAAVKRWRHPFGDKSNPLQQLTQLANAVAGYYPIGVNGMWHGGVHFDSGTAGILKQDHVRCIADGEVVAYRIPGKTPKTTYFPAPGVTVAAPFASAFVLVRHRLEAPALEGSTDKPPSLIFFSLYMHLQDWESYKSNTEIKRPAFWPEGFTLRVKDTANDTALGAPNQRGLNLLHQPSRQGKAIGFLPRGATLAVTGQGDYRKLKGSKGPQGLQSDDGSLRGYIEFSRLQLSAGDVYSVAGASAALDVLAEADAKSEKLFKLPKGSEVTISGEGRFRKLESVAQYVQYASLERLRKPAVQNRVLVLETPAPIKAGELIGHLGPYQESNETSPQEKLHLEVFTADDMKSFLAASRAWAARMPASEKTWLKIAGCVPVVTHQDRFSATNPPTLFEPGSASTADLLVPKNLLDDLPPERKIQLPAVDGRNAINWYRLDNLLNDLDGKLLEGWVREEVGVTPWVNPWSWDGYDIIVNDDPPENGLAYVMDALGLSKEEDRERNRPRIDASDKGPVKTRLYDIIDRDRNDKGSDEGGRNGKITATEMRDAIRVPAYAQSIAQLIIHYESEWYYQQSKWDALDKVLGHTTSAPMLNWVAEKERIKQLGWWEEVATGGILPKGAKVYHLHPISLVGWLGCKQGKITRQMLKLVFEGLRNTSGKDDLLQGMADEISENAEDYKLDTPLRLSHFFAQVREEVGATLEVEEHSFIFSVSYLKENFRYFIDHPAEASDYGYTTVKTSLPLSKKIELANRMYCNKIGNGDVSSGDGWKYRGRGLKHLTGKSNYRGFSDFHKEFWGEGVDFSASPDLVHLNPKYALRSGVYFWMKNELYKIADRGAAPENVNEVTKIVNRSTTSYKERRDHFRRIFIDEKIFLDI